MGNEYVLDEKTRLIFERIQKISLHVINNTDFEVLKLAQKFQPLIENSLKASYAYSDEFYKLACKMVEIANKAIVPNAGETMTVGNLINNFSENISDYKEILEQSINNKDERIAKLEVITEPVCLDIKEVKDDINTLKAKPSVSVWEYANRIMVVIELLRIIYDFTGTPHEIRQNKKQATQPAQTINIQVVQPIINSNFDMMLNEDINHLTAR